VIAGPDPGVVEKTLTALTYKFVSHQKVRDESKSLYPCFQRKGVMAAAAVSRKTRASIVGRGNGVADRILRIFAKVEMKFGFQDRRSAYEGGRGNRGFPGSKKLRTQSAISNSRCETRLVYWEFPGAKYYFSSTGKTVQRPRTK